MAATSKSVLGAKQLEELYVRTKGERGEEGGKGGIGKEKREGGERRTERTPKGT